MKYSKNHSNPIQRSSWRGRRLHPSRGGGVLVLALVSVVVVAALTAAFLQSSMAVTARQVQMRERMQAFYVAEAGLSEAWTAVSIEKTGSVGSEEEPAVFGNGLFWVEATELGGDLLRLESTGRTGGGSATLSVIVRKGEASVADLGVYAPSPIDLPPGSFLDGYDSRLGYGPDGAYVPPSSEQLDALLDSFTEQVGGLLGGGGGLLDSSAPTGGGEGAEPPAPPEPVRDDPYTGRIASGGGINATGTPEAPTVIAGDLVPGPESAVTVGGDVTVTGSTEPARLPVDLPEIRVPNLASLAGVRHGGAAPLLVLPTEAHLPELSIGPGAEVIVQGPATLVVDSLTLAAGAQLYLDVLEGEVEIFVTDRASFAEDARVSNSTEDPSRLSLQFTAAPADPIGLPAGGPLHGVIYAPDASVVVPPGFELFGSLVAGSIVFGGPPRLHFDEHLAEVARERALPELFSWRIVELTSTAAAGGGDPFVLMGLDRSLLPPPAAAHADQDIDVTYEDSGGTQQRYTGAESGFDWSQVSKVDALSRGGSKVVGEEDKGLLAAPVDALLKTIQDTAKTSSDLRDELLAASPLSDSAVLAAIVRTPPMDASHLHDVLLANSPLTDAALTKTIFGGVLGSSDLRDVLVQESPLSAKVLSDATATLSPADLLTLLGVQ